MKALAGAMTLVALVAITSGQRLSGRSSINLTDNPSVQPSPTPQLRPINKQMVEAWNEIVSSIDEENKALKEEDDAFLQLQTSLKIHAPWLELDIEGKHRLNRAALIGQIIESHQKRAAAYQRRIALLRKLQFADR
jgi:hypothetical protein